MRNLPALILSLACTWIAGLAAGQQPATPPVKKAKLGETSNVHVCGKLFLAGQPAPGDLKTIKALDLG